MPGQNISPGANTGPRTVNMERKNELANDRTAVPIPRDQAQCLAERNPIPDTSQTRARTEKMRNISDKTALIRTSATRPSPARIESSISSVPRSVMVSGLGLSIVR